MTTPNLHDYDYVLINSSAGKDSQTALRKTVRLAYAQRYPLSRLVVVHADVGEAEWDGVPELARKQARFYGLEFIVVRRRTKDGTEEQLLDYVRRRGMFPSSTTRWCTSDFKRAPCQRVITELGRRVQQGDRKKPVNILQVFGFRAQESPARAKKPVIQKSKTASTKSRTVIDWHPILDWTEDQVWDDIAHSGVPYHPAYDLGMPRLSCVFCVFAPEHALKIAGRANPELLDKYVEVEAEIGHTFRKDFAIASIKEQLLRKKQS